MRIVRAVMLLLAIGSAGQAFAANPYLQQGELLYDNVEYERGLALLEKALTFKGTTTKERAQIYLYLGLCRYQVGDAAGAQAAFREAIQIDHTVALPAMTSPKIVPVFNGEMNAYLKAHPEARQEAFATDVKSRAPEHTMRVPAYVAAGVAAALVATAAGFGLAARSANQQAVQAPWGSDAASAQSVATSRATTANILYASGGAVAAVGVVLFFAF